MEATIVYWGYIGSVIKPLGKILNIPGAYPVQDVTRGIFDGKNEGIWGGRNFLIGNESMHGVGVNCLMDLGLFDGEGRCMPIVPRRL